MGRRERGEREREREGGGGREGKGGGGGAGSRHTPCENGPRLFMYRAPADDWGLSSASRGLQGRLRKYNNTAVPSPSAFSHLTRKRARPCRRRTCGRSSPCAPSRQSRCARLAQRDGRRKNKRARMRQTQTTRAWLETGVLLECRWSCDGWNYTRQCAVRPLTVLMLVLVRFGVDVVAGASLVLRVVEVGYDELQHLPPTHRRHTG